MTREEIKDFCDMKVQLEPENEDIFKEILKALEQEPREDATLKDIFCMGCEYKEQEPCEDAISRQAVLDELNKWDWQELYLPVYFKENIIDVVPSVKQEPKTGHWIPVDDKNDAFDCSECIAMVARKTNYCPRCGCRMVEPQESEG